LIPPRRCTWNCTWLCHLGRSSLTLAFLIVRLKKQFVARACTDCLKRMLRRSKCQSDSAMRRELASSHVLFFTTRTRHNLLTIACRLHYIGDIRHRQHRARVAARAAATAPSVVALGVLAVDAAQHHGAPDSSRGRCALVTASDVRPDPGRCRHHHLDAITTAKTTTAAHPAPIPRASRLAALLATGAAGGPAVTAATTTVGTVAVTAP
jgi:hypothetical protein